MLAGVFCLVAAGAAFSQLGGTRAGTGPASAPVAPVAPSSAAPETPGSWKLSPGDVSVVNQRYEPGQDSGWHRHPGIHAVTIVTGTLTVYDDQCRRQAFGPGEPYVGGQQLHLTINEAAVPVEMWTTYVSPPASTNVTQHSQAPAGCQVGG